MTGRRTAIVFEVFFALLLALSSSCVVEPGAAAARVPAAVRGIVLPDAGPQAILDLVASARSSLWMEMYLLTDDRAIAALVGRAQAGCDVRVILEPAPYLAAGANDAAYARLAAAGATVRWATPRFAFTHAKAFTIDHARLVVMTANLTRAGLTANREYAAVDDAPADVAAAETIFAADALGAPTTAAAATTDARLVTSPERSRAAWLELAAGARSTLAVEVEELGDPEITGALTAARLRGVSVRVVIPAPASARASAIAALVGAGVDVRAVATPPVHAKALVADGRHLYLGSANLTSTSLDGNRELGLGLTQPDLAALVEQTIAADGARGVAPTAALY